MNETSVIIACAGKSSRMGGLNKQLEKIGGEPVFLRSARIFETLDEVFEIIFCVSETDQNEFERILTHNQPKKPYKIVIGGETRTESVINAVKQCASGAKFIAVHDGARPFAKAETIRQCIKDAAIFGASCLATPVKDTVKFADGGIVTDTPDRRKLFLIQTPQVFRRDIFTSAVNFAVANNLEFTDDAAMVEAVGAKVHLTISDYGNFKITTPEDLDYARFKYNNYEKN
jgi:2-C-methyl-D-erythritol 4-phosphate cytidylyltransferase